MKDGGWLADYHTHSWRCGHAIGEMSEYIDAAIAAGLDEIGLSDHLFFYFRSAAAGDSKWAIPERDFDRHYSEMLDLREHYRGDITVRIGVEADYMRGHEATLEDIFRRYSFDYVLGSVHFVDGWMIDDPDNVHRYEKGTVELIYRHYFAEITHAANSALFDVLAHFDLPKKFGILPDGDVTEMAGHALDAIAAAGMAIEVSTAGLRKPIGEIYPSPAILAEMHRRAIPIVLSSDAHRPAEVGAGFEASMALVRSIGYRSIVTFEDRKPRHLALRAGHSSTSSVLMAES